MHLFCICQNDTEFTQDEPVQKTLLRRCLSHVKYLFAVLLIPPFLNYVALLQESAQLMPSGTRLYCIYRSSNIRT